MFGKWTALFLILGLGCLASGCAGPRPTAPTVDSRTLPSHVFQAYLAEVDLITVEEAYRAILILADGEDDPAGTFESRKANLESRGIARAAWGLQPENVVDAGSVAYMVCQVCKIDGGVNMNLFGRTGLGDRRYALRELIYMGMIDDSVDYQYMTGGAFAALLRKADTLMQEKGLYESQGIDLSDKTDRDAEGNLIVPPPVSPATEPADGE